MEHIKVSTQEELIEKYNELDNGNPINFINLDRGQAHVFSHEWEGVGIEAGPVADTFIRIL